MGDDDSIKDKINKNLQKTKQKLELLHMIGLLLSPFYF